MMQPASSDWEPLRSVVGERHCAAFMFIAASATASGTTVYLYKHTITRRYLNLDTAGQSYRWTGSGYEPQPLADALAWAFN